MNLMQPWKGMNNFAQNMLTYRIYIFKQYPDNIAK
jgi:hypothetical protein